MTRPPNRVPTLTEIGRLCNVDKSTVYRALTGSGRVSPKTVEKVRAVAKKLGYDPARNRAAQRLAAHRSETKFHNHAVALILPRHFHRHMYYHRLHAGILHALAEADYDLLTAQADPQGIRLPKAVLAGEVDAIIVVGAAHLDRLAVSDSLPVVTIATPAPHRAAVLPDDEAAAYLAAEHLLKLGHRRIFQFFTGYATHPGPTRIKGYQRACRDCGLNPKDVVLGLDLPNDLPHPRWIARHVTQGLQQYPDITAMLAPNDEDARTIHDALLHRGLRVPDHISLVGCDDVCEIGDAHGHNLLTTVDMSLYGLGESAVRLAIEGIEGRSIADDRVTLPVRLVVRRSTDPPRVRS